eukprot:TRINITY_DN1580_c0_g1_i6.p2 TRINITY_DN1580_c0_g1~~TRINITY_DN1580_c0_g1_i6.p2  ORF type:complete len:668 (+),score=208.95 TRINITY_DN1580_c0_g1_i6:27-2006(+)
MNSSVQLREELQSRTRSAGSKSLGRSRQADIRDPFSHFLDLFVSILESYKQSGLPEDLHALRFFEDQKVPESDQAFIEDVFHGTVRNEKLVKGVVSAYYAANPKLTKRDSTLYTVLVYLFVCHPEDGGFDNFRAFVLSQPMLTVQPLLAFMFDESNLDRFASAWLASYDPKFVEQLCAKIRERLPEARQLLDHVDRKVQGTHQPPLPQVVVPDPFNLSVSKPRVASARPATSPAVMVHARPVPESSLPGYEDPVLVKARLQREAARRLRMSQALERAKTPQFSAIHSKKDLVKQQIEAQRAAELQFDFTAPPVPSYLHAEPPLQIDDLMSSTRSLVLRQAALIKKTHEQRARAQQEKHVCKRDSTEFDQWQQKMRQQDQDKKDQEVQERKQQMRMAFLAGIEAKLESLEEVRTMVNFMHQERDALEARRAQLEEQEVQQNRRTASAVQSQRASARAATAAVSKRNYEAAMDTLHTIAAHKAEVASHRQQIEEQAARRHQRLVAEGKINPAPFTFSGQYRTAGVGGAPPMGVTGVVTTWMAAKFRDPDAMPGLGFLGELSLNQVKARIAEVAKEKEEYLNDKREELRKAHEDEESNRQKFTEQINGHRAHSAHLTQKRNEDQKQRELSDSQKRKQQREGALKGYLDTFENTRLGQLVLVF